MQGRDSSKNTHGGEKQQKYTKQTAVEVHACKKEVHAAKSAGAMLLTDLFGISSEPRSKQLKSPIRRLPSHISSRHKNANRSNEKTTATESGHYPLLHLPGSHVGREEAGLLHHLVGVALLLRAVGGVNAFGCRPAKGREKKGRKMVGSNKLISFFCPSWGIKQAIPGEKCGGLQIL